MSTPNYVNDLEERVSLLEQQRSPSLPTPETLFDIFDGIRVRRPFLGPDQGFRQGYLQENGGGSRHLGF